MANTYDGGIVTAYGAAVRGGYTGTYEQFCAEQAQFGANAAAVAAAKIAVDSAKSQVDQTVNTFTQTTVPNAVSSVQSAGTEQSGLVQNAGTAQTQAVNSAGAAQVSAVQSEGSTQTHNVELTALSAIGQINDARSDAVDAVEAAESEAVAAVEAAETAATGAVTAAQTAAVQAVQTESSTQQAAIQTKGQETIASIPEDYTALTEEVDGLKSSMSNLEQTVAIPFSSSEGYINTNVSVGATVNTTPVTGSGFNYIIEPCKKGDVFTLTAKGGSASRVWAFTDADYKLLSKSAPSITVTALSLTADADGYFIANNAQNYSNPSCSKTAILNVDAIEQIANDTITDVITDYSKINDIFNGFSFSPETWGVGSYTQNIGSESVIFATNARRYTPVMTKSFPVYIYSDGTYKFTVLYLNSSNILLAKYTEMTGLFVVPENTNYRVIIQNASDSTTDISAVTAESINSHVKIYNNDLSDLLDPSNPVKWCAMGDSITEGYYSYLDGSDVGHYSIDKINTWVYSVSRINKWALTNIAIGGTGFLKPFNNAEDDHSTGYYVARHTDYSGYDLITLAYGVNDWKANLQLGSLSDDASAVTPTTVIQAMKATIEAILASNPNCKIIGILPLNCAGYDKNYGTKATNWGLGYAFSNSGTLEQFVTALISVYDYYGIQYVDMTHYSSVNRENLLTALPDGVHPSIVTHNLMAHELSKKITF